MPANLSTARQKGAQQRQEGQLPGPSHVGEEGWGRSAQHLGAPHPHRLLLGVANSLPATVRRKLRMLYKP